MPKLKELYALKGEAQTQVEIWTGRIREINQQISAEIAKGNEMKPKTEELPEEVSPTGNGQ